MTAILQFLIGQASWIGLVRIVSLFGAPALAAYTIGIRIVIFAILPSWGLSNAAATLVGQNLGARPPDARAQAVWRTGFWNMLFLGPVGVVFIAFAPRIIGLFTHDPAVLDTAIRVPTHLQLRQYRLRLRHGPAAGLQWCRRHPHPHLRESLRLLGSGIPLAWWLAMHTAMRINGVFASVVVAQSVIVLISLVLFRRGRWAQQRI